MVSVPPPVSMSVALKLAEPSADRPAMEKDVAKIVLPAAAIPALAHIAEVPAEIHAMAQKIAPPLLVVYQTVLVWAAEVVVI